MTVETCFWAPCMYVCALCVSVCECARSYRLVSQHSNCRSCLFSFIISLPSRIRSNSFNTFNVYFSLLLLLLLLFCVIIIMMSTAMAAANSLARGSVRYVLAIRFCFFVFFFFFGSPLRFSLFCMCSVLAHSHIKVFSSCTQSVSQLVFSRLFYIQAFLL